MRDSKKFEESDDYLLELIGIKEDFPEEALIAYGKLYERYWEVMYSIALIICQYSKEKEKDAEDLVSDTFNIVYHKKAASFDKTKLSQKNVRISIISWLKTVMMSVHYDFYIDESAKAKIHQEKVKAKENGNNEEYFIPGIPTKINLNRFFDDIHMDVINEIEKSDENEAVQDDCDYEKDNMNISLVSNYLNSLSERDADIIRTIYSFYTPGKNTPSEVLDLLQERWGTTRDNIRRILKNFRDRIKEELTPKIELRKYNHESRSRF